MKFKRINPNRINLIKRGNDQPQEIEQVTAIPAPMVNNGYAHNTRRTLAKGVPLVMVKEAETK